MAANRYLDPSISFSCITFGSPPALRPQLTPQYCSAGDGSLMLNVINEYDLVPRIDGPYVRSLVDLYRSIYKLPPIQEAGPQVFGTSAEAQTPPAEVRSSQAVAEEEEVGKHWSVPNPEYWHIGERVVLRRSITTRHASDDPKEELALSALSVAAEEFAKLLFCRLTVHRRVQYQERVELIAEGRFNGRHGWLIETSETPEAIRDPDEASNETTLRSTVGES